MFRRSLAFAIVLFACDSTAADADPADTPADPEAGAKSEPDPEPEPEPSVDEGLKSDYETLCNAKELSGANEVEPAMAASHIAKYIGENVKSKDVLELMGSLASMAPDQRGQALRDAAAAAGVSPCPLAAE